MDKLAASVLPIATPAVAAVLSVSPIESDHILLEHIFKKTRWTLYTDFKWTLHTAHTAASAFRTLRENQISVVLCEGDESPEAWKEILEQLAHLPDAASLIVASRLADERLWAEALNLGAHDVLAKPFHPEELIHAVTAAWRHWLDQQEKKRRRLRDRIAVEQWNAAAG